MKDFSNCENNLNIMCKIFLSLCVHSLELWTLIQSLCCDDMECKNSQHQNCAPGACRRSFIMTNILNNNRSLSASRNSSFCTRTSGGINHSVHARRIAQLLLSPTGSSLPANDCSTCPPRRASTKSEMVCVSYRCLPLHAWKRKFLFIRINIFSNLGFVRELSHLRISKWWLIDGSIKERKNWSKSF